MTIYNTLIIGAGKIGALFDVPDSENVLTHAHGFRRHVGFKLLGFIDSDFHKAQIAAERWNCLAFKNIEEAFNHNKIDVVSVTVPDEHHYSILYQLSAFPIICFKDFGSYVTGQALHKILHLSCFSDLFPGFNEFG